LSLCASSGSSSLTGKTSSLASSNLIGWYRSLERAGRRSTSISSSRSCLLSVVASPSSHAIVWGGGRASPVSGDSDDTPKLAHASYSSDSGPASFDVAAGGEPAASPSTSGLWSTCLLYT